MFGTVRATLWVAAGTGDFDGNGSTDLLWHDNDTGTVAIWLLGGLQVLQRESWRGAEQLVDRYNR
jgi:hypothetical protein